MIVKGWEPVEHWYSEHVNHAYGKEPSTLKTGHFTQVKYILSYLFTQRVVGLVSGTSPPHLALVYFNRIDVHFQVIWRDSRELGVGMARNRSGQIFVVANYDPPGNFIGSFAENVPPIGGFIETDDTSKQLTIPTDMSTEQSKEDGANLDVFIKAILRYHNEYRRKHGVNELK